jgi:hypothetical protein
MSEVMMPRFGVAKRTGWRAFFSPYKWAIVAVIDGNRKVVAVSHDQEVAEMVAGGLNEWGRMEAKLNAMRGKGPRIVTLG